MVRTCYHSIGCIKTDALTLETFWDVSHGGYDDLFIPRVVSVVDGVPAS